MHILVTQDVERIKLDNGKTRIVRNYRVRAYQSLTLAVREMYKAHQERQMVQFCIDHPFEDALTLDDLYQQEATDA